MHLKWAEDNIMVKFSKIWFMDKFRTTLDGLDSWSKGWAVNKRHQCLRCQQSGRGIMIGLWKVPDGIKMTAGAFLREHLELWIKKQRIIFRRIINFLCTIMLPRMKCIKLWSIGNN